MFDLHKMFGYSHKLAEEGVNMALGADPEEYIKVRKLPNPDYRAMLNKEYRAAEAALSNPDLSVQNAVSDGIMSRVIAETAVIGWGKKFGVKGKNVAFTPSACAELFLEYPEFRQKVVAFAEDIKNFQETPEVSADAVKKH